MARAKLPLNLEYEKTIHITRDENGVPHINGETQADVYFGQGFMHAMDRGMQMLLTRLAGYGRTSEFLGATDELLQLDIFFRRLNLGADLHRESLKVSPETTTLFRAYAAGVNYFFEHYRPWELKLLKYKPEPWKIEDTMIILKIMGYLSLGQSQGELERLLVQMVQAGVSRKKLDELFPDLLKGLKEGLVGSVKISERVIPEEVLLNNPAPKMMASNNWAVSGDKTHNGKPILASDPHLEVNRLPNIFYEQTLHCGERYAMGVSVPGIPSIMLGRNNDLAWGATYSFTDCIDSWVEDCRGGKYKRNSEESAEWVKFDERREIIKRKKKPDHKITFYENQHGVLDGNPHEVGYYLATRWSAGTGAGARSMDNLFQVFEQNSVEAAMPLFGGIEVSFCWMLADESGNIGMQTSGLVPKRRAGISGLVPLPGWEEQNDWKGFQSYQDLPRSLNPADGILVTANNNLNHLGNCNPISVAMGSYRADRIRQLLEGREDLTGKDMAEIQYDVYSLQAELFMDILRPLLPEDDSAKVLADWDLKYSIDSKGAYVFENFYRELYNIVFGELAMGEDVIQYLWDHTGITVDFYESFDKILLSEESAWFGDKSRESIFRLALERALKTGAKKWGAVNRLIMENIMFGKMAPSFLGYNKGPVQMAGNRATPRQAQIYQSGGRASSFSAAYHMIVDFFYPGMRSNLCGGVSEKRFSRLYYSDFTNWLQGKYKLVKP